MNDTEKTEMQRYEEIKSTGEYLELNIIIGKQDILLPNGHRGKKPVIINNLRNIGSNEIGCMYTILAGLINYYEKEYPLESLVARQLLNTSDVSSIVTPIEDDDEED